MNEQIKDYNAEEVIVEFVSDKFIFAKMRANDFLPLSRGWFGYKILSVQRDYQNFGFNYFLLKNNEITRDSAKIKSSKKPTQ